MTCGLIFRENAPEDLSLLYDEGYYGGTNEYAYIDERDDKFLRDIENTRRLINLKRFVKSEHPTLLDVGCSFGSFVKKANELGFMARGIDISKHATFVSRMEGLPIREQDVCNYVTGKYDIITLAEAMEHLRDPMQAIKNCYNALNSNGIILIQTTNMDSLVRRYEGETSRYFLPGHLFYFSEATLEKMLRYNGFKVEKVYYGHETGLIPALIRKSISNLRRCDIQDWLVLLYTLLVHLGSKIHIHNVAMHNGMVVIARKLEK